MVLIVVLFEVFVNA